MRPYLCSYVSESSTCNWDSSSPLQAAQCSSTDTSGSIISHCGLSLEYSQHRRVIASGCLKNHVKIAEHCFKKNTVKSRICKHFISVCNRSGTILLMTSPSLQTQTNATRSHTVRLVPCMYFADSFITNQNLHTNKEDSAQQTSASRNQQAATLTKTV